MVGRNISKTLEHLPEIERRLAHVVIENRDFESILKAYDKSGSLFYLDPPYYAAERHYDATFTVDDHRRLRDLLGRIKGKFVLSYNDCAFVRGLYDDFGIYSVERSNNLANKVGGGNVYGEVIIKN
ncbi:hypothetical protein FACS1894208_04570 [Clostridia bacterium]|nr:hypothetical protein FACS1894208_04570 [Clostridia bacterium]